MLTKYHRLPEWLRWLLLIPLTVLLTAGTCEAVARILGQHYFIVRQVVAVGSFILFIYLFAPRWQRRLALVVLIARVVLVAGVVIVGRARGNALTEEVWVDVGRDVLGWVAGGVLLWLLASHVRVERNEPNQPPEPTR